MRYFLKPLINLKSAGPDGVYAGSIKFAHHRLHVLLSFCFSLCFTYRYMPKDMTETSIVPIIKKNVENLQIVLTTGPLQLQQFYQSFLSLSVSINV